MFRLYAIIFLTLLNLPILAQTKRYIVTGRVTDIDKNPIPFAAIQNIETKEGAVTNNLGRYAFSTTLPLIIKVSRIGYKSVIRKVNNTGKNDTMEVDFVLQVDSAQLQSIQITATSQSNLIKESSVLDDFETHNGKLWLLYSYSKEDRLEVYDSTMNFVASAPLKYRATQLMKTPHNFLYITDKDSVWLLDYFSGNKSINNISMNAGKFLQNLNGLVAYSYPYYYYTNVNNYGAVIAPYKFFFQLYSLSRSHPFSYYSSLANYGAFITYYYYNKLNNSKTILYRYKDESIALNNRDALYQMTGSNGSSSDSSGASQMPGYFGQSTNDIMEKCQAIAANAQAEFDPFPELFAQQKWRHIICPLRIIKDTVYIFNFDNDTIYSYKPDNMKIKSIPLTINIHGVKYQKRDVIVNDEGTACYFKFELAGTVYLQMLNLNTGKVISSEKLTQLFPEKIRIMGGYAYYSCTRIARNQSGALFLYRQKL